MRCGGQGRANPCRQALGQRHVLRAVRPAGVRVAEAQRPNHLVVAHDRNDERRRRGESALQHCRRAAARALIVAVNAAAQRGLARAHDGSGSAGEVVAPDRPRADHGAHLAGEFARAVPGGDAPERSWRGDVYEVEVGETGKRPPRREIGAPLCRYRRLPLCARRCGNAVHPQSFPLPNVAIQLVRFKLNDHPPDQLQ
jgi:hypothetical protein